MMEFVKGWKTLGIMGLFTALGLLQQADWAQLVPPQYVGLAVATVGAAGMILRAITTTPVGAKS